MYNNQKEEGGGEGRAGGGGGQFGKMLNSQNSKLYHKVF